MNKFKIKSFCKINLSLRVLKELNNGYHNIRSLITFCDLHDVISISKIRSLNDKISFSGEFKKGISVESNTATKTLNLLRKIKLLKNQAFRINIRKNITCRAIEAQGPWRREQAWILRALSALHGRCRISGHLPARTSASWTS